MKILAIGDPHGKLPKKLDKIIKSNKVEVIICIGDIPPVPEAFRKGKIDYFPMQFLKKADKIFKEIIDKLCSYKKPVLVLRGNMYLTGYRNILTKNIFKSHKNLIYKKTGRVKIFNQNFIFFDMSFEPHMYSEHSSWIKMQFISAEKRAAKLNDILKKTKDPIIISHAPPFGYLDIAKKGHRGSKILLDAIRKHAPKVVLCGHIHERKGKAIIGKTEVYNLGCRGSYKVLKF